MKKEELKKLIDTVRSSMFFPGRSRQATSH